MKVELLCLDVVVSNHSCRRVLQRFESIYTLLEKI
jgi:hypothetical protein